ncbi:MAG TPA: molecular chaperone DnaK, partial [Candidatus Binatia bacterium]|nr:molecular chaperone DnaK [Candidatus Binatia bacterium]
MTGIIGIDLGTYASLVAIVEDGQPTVITTSEGSRVPSVVTFNRSSEPAVGQRARRQAALSPADAVYSVKRLLGRRFDDPVVQLVREQQPFAFRCGPNGEVEIATPASGRGYSTQQVVSMILQRLRQEAESYLGSQVRQAVLAVPTQFDDRQRQAAKEAAKLAGLEVRRVINEPTAAALAYSLGREERQKVLVVDLGHGHYDVSLLEVQDGAVKVFASDGDAALGCEDWDSAIAGYLAEEFLRHYGVDLKKNHHALRRLRSAAEETRKQLSQDKRAMIHLPFITSAAEGPKHFNTALTRSRYEAQTASLSARLAPPIQRVLADSNWDSSSLDTVLLLGGGSQIPAVKDVIQEVVGSTPLYDGSAEELVALGAALQAGLLAGEVRDVALQDVTPLSLGLETMGGLMTPIIPRNTAIPARRTEIFSTTEDEQAEVQIRVLQGERPMACDNSNLGVFYLRGIPSAPRGVPQIEVTFEVDADGILHVSARDLASGSSQALSVTAPGALAAADVHRLVEEAESHEAEDLRRRDLVEARNLAQQTIYQTQRCLRHLNG